MTLLEIFEQEGLLRWVKLPKVMRNIRYDLYYKGQMMYSCYSESHVMKVCEKDLREFDIKEVQIK